MKAFKYLLIVSMIIGLTTGFTGCGSDSESDDSKDGATNSVGSLSTIAGSSLAPANSTTAAGLAAFFNNEPDSKIEKMIDDMASLGYWEEDSYESPFSFTYQCETSGSIAFSGTYVDYELATLTAVADNCVGGSYYIDEIDGTVYYAKTDSSETYEAKTNVVFDNGYYGAGTVSQGSSIVYTINGSSASAVENMEFTETDGTFYRVENLTYDITLDEYDEMTSLDIKSGRIYVSDTTYVDFVSDDITVSYGEPEGDVVFSAADDGVLTATFAAFSTTTVAVTTESTTGDTSDDTSGSTTAMTLSDAVTVNGTLTTATDKMTYEATDFTGVSFTCSYVYIRVEDVNGSTDNPDSGLTADVNVTIYKDGVESITLDPSPGYAVGSLKAIDSSYNVISKITVEVEPKDNSADNVGTFTIKYSNPCN